VILRHLPTIAPFSRPTWPVSHQQEGGKKKNNNRDVGMRMAETRAQAQEVFCVNFSFSFFLSSFSFFLLSSFLLLRLSFSSYFPFSFSSSFFFLSFFFFLSESRPAQGARGAFAHFPGRLGAQIKCFHQLARSHGCKEHRSVEQSKLGVEQLPWDGQDLYPFMLLLPYPRPPPAPFFQQQ
jgi:hypothetical protein